MNRRRLMALKKSGGGLPDGFTAVEYIQTSGSQYIDTGVKASASAGLSADFCLVDTRSPQSFAQVYENSAGRYELVALQISSVGSPDGSVWFLCGYFNTPQYFKKADTDRHIYMSVCVSLFKILRCVKISAKKPYRAIRRTNTGYLQSHQLISSSAILVYLCKALG